MLKEESLKRNIVETIEKHARNFVQSKKLILLLIMHL